MSPLGDSQRTVLPFRACPRARHRLGKTPSRRGGGGPPKTTLRCRVLAAVGVPVTLDLDTSVCVPVSLCRGLTGPWTTMGHRDAQRSSSDGQSKVFTKSFPQGPIPVSDSSEGPPQISRDPPKPSLPEHRRGSPQKSLSDTFLTLLPGPQSHFCPGATNHPLSRFSCPMRPPPREKGATLGARGSVRAELPSPASLAVGSPREPTSFTEAGPTSELLPVTP